MTQPDSPEFLAILERVPRWHMLTPVEQIKDGDEIWHHGDRVSGFWKKVIAIGTVNSRPFRRPIPEHVRRSEAWWALYNQLAEIKHFMVSKSTAWFCIVFCGNDYAKKEPMLDIQDEWAIDGLKGFKSEAIARSAIPILGGEQEIIKNLQEGPGAYMRWVFG